MTDRIRVVTVILDNDYRDDDVVEILNAISMVKGVNHVEPKVVAPGESTTRAVVALEMRRKVFKALEEALPIWPK